MVVVGVAVAVAVLAGALLVGASVRESLRELALGRLGATDVVVTSPTFFRAALADEITRAHRRSIAAPMIVFTAPWFTTNQTHGRPRVGLRHRRAVRPLPRHRGLGVPDARRGQRRAGGELGAHAGDSVTLRVARPTDIPLQPPGPPRGTGERIRLTVARVLDRERARRVLARTSQGPVLAIYCRWRGCSATSASASAST